MKNKRQKVMSLLYLFFILSGMTGLIYQVLWSRKLSIIFGHTVFAVSSILAAFMGGLALGSYLIGRLVDRMDDGDKLPPLLKNLLKGSFSPQVRLYGVLELFIGLYALLTPFLIDLVGNIYVAVMGAFSLSLYPISIITFLLSMIIFILPTMAMGATLPLVLKFVISTYGELMEKTARLYAINTLGAVVGSFLAGFILFPVMGLKATLTAAALINILIGIAAILADRNLPEDSLKSDEKIPSESSPAPSNSPVGEEDRGLFRLVLTVFFISGFTSMVYEVCWSRALALSIGSSVYSFSTILVTFLFGITLGSYIFSNSSLFNQDRINVETLGHLETAVGVLGLIIMPALGFLPYVFLKIFPAVKSSYFLVVAGNFIISFLVILPPTVLLGMTFPLVVKVYTRDLNNLGRSIGEVYASNTAGNILGSFLSGFLLIPVLGVENSLKLAIILNLIAGGLIYYQTGRKKKFDFSRGFRLAVVASALLVTVFIQAWKHSAMSLGSSVYASIYSKIKTVKEFNDILADKARQIIFYRDGISCTVTVMKLEDVVYLKVNGKTDASYSPKGTQDMYTQWLQGFIPSALHPNPERVCVIGFGSGITAAAVSQFDEVKVLDSVEIEPVVMDVARYFRDGNMDVVNNPKFRNHIADGRNFVLASKEKYDIIISEPSNPWIAGIGNLFSRDFYRVCYEKLKDDGIYCQWIHTYGMSADTVKMVMNTFYGVFPHGNLWITQQGDLMLIGRKKDMPLDFQRLKSVIARNEKVTDYMKIIGFDDPLKILGLYITDAKRVRAFAMGSRINTDDRPFLEFDAPRNMYAEIDRMVVVRELLAYQDPNDTFSWVSGLDEKILKDAGFFANIGRVRLQMGLYDGARRAFVKASALNPFDIGIYLDWAQTEEQDNRYLKALSILNTGIEKIPGNPAIYLVAAGILQKRGALDEGIRILKSGLEKIPDDRELLNRLVVLLMLNRHYEDALKPAQKLISIAPASVPYRLYLGRILLETDKTDQAETIFKKILEESPDNLIALEGMGDVFMKKGKKDDALAFYRKATEKFPGELSSRIRLAGALEEMGQIPDALNQYREALKINPVNPEARMGLVRCSKE